MKKLLTILMALCLVLTLTACANNAEETEENKEEETEEVVGMPNPKSEVSSLEELNKKVNGKLNHPGVMGISDESYFFIDGDKYDIGEYNFTVGGNEYTLRFCDRAPVSVDISGIYLNEGQAFPSDEFVDEIEYAQSDEYKLARWLNLDGQYCFMVKDNGELDKNDFITYAKELIKITEPDSQVAK